MLVHAPIIGLFRHRSRRWASCRIRAGRYGPVMRLGGKADWVQLDRVEAEGVRFSVAQLVAAGRSHSRPRGERLNSCVQEE